MVVTRAGGWWVVGAAGAGPLVLPSRFPSRPLSVAVRQLRAVARPLPPIPGALAETAAVSATTVKIQLTQSPLPT